MKCHGLGDSHPVTHLRPTLLLGSPSVLQLCYSRPLARALGLCLALSQWQARSPWLCDSALFSCLCSEESLIPALLSGYWGLGETRGDLAMGQLTKLSWAIWRGPGPPSLGLISSYVLPPLRRTLRCDLLVSFCDSAAASGITQVSRPIRSLKIFERPLTTDAKEGPHLWYLLSVVINSLSHYLLFWASVSHSSNREGKKERKKTEKRFAFQWLESMALRRGADPENWFTKWPKAVCMYCAVFCLFVFWQMCDCEAFLFWHY